MKKKKTKKEFFIDYLLRFGNDASIFDIGRGKIILSFSGSDGPDIEDTGFEDDYGDLISFEDTKKVDEYIKEGCGENYSTEFCNNTPNYPSMTWTDYYNKYIKGV